MDTKQMLMSEMVWISVTLRQIKLREDPEYFKAEWKKLKEFDNVIEEAGENILYQSAQKGETSKAFNAMCQAIALLSFLPGGIEIFGKHFICDQVSTNDKQNTTNSNNNVLV